MKVKYRGLCGYCLRCQRFFTDVFGVVMLGRAKLLERYYGLVCLCDVSGTIVRQHSRRSLLSCAITDTHTVCAFWEAYNMKNDLKKAK
ncbi:hypothetical protein T08_11003 [Trichinella sp. T8]|nr:hypothetical protein T08_7854 [Trichinella sp. T8]KRZ91738.1 hypothetical protein T08_11003 [Trichinella sp. T8]